MNHYLDALRKYAVFSGRAQRAEYWYFLLFNLVIGLVLFSLGTFLGKVALFAYWIYAVAVLIPSIAVSVRRLHDTNRSGWWVLISLVPIVGGIILLVFMVLDSDPNSNQYGPNLKSTMTAAV